MRRWLGKKIYQAKRAFGGKAPPRVAILRFEGVIASKGRMRQGLNLAAVAPQLDAAFALPGLTAVALQINSPGGSPVQSALIMQRVRALALENDVHVTVFCEDVAASGGYMLALAGDEIYAHEASLVGSIGVISGGFGFVDAMAKIGVERRIYTAGEKKVMLDPFTSEKQEDVERIAEIQADIHEVFKKLVRDRRGKRLKGLRGKIFSGDVFTGGEAMKLGLIDGLGDLRTVMRDRFGDAVEFKTFAEKKAGLAGLVGMLGDNDARAVLPAASPISGGDGIANLGANLGDHTLEALEVRSVWSRFGL